MLRYFDRMWKLSAENTKILLQSGLSPKEAEAAAWSATYKQLWEEFSCCYYSCKYFSLSAFCDIDAETLQELYELSRELAGYASPTPLDD